MHAAGPGCRHNHGDMSIFSIDSVWAIGYRQVISSLDLDSEHIAVIASTTEVQDAGMMSRLVVQVPRLKAYLTGTGEEWACCLKHLHN